jgi:hypothetical protein
VSEAVLAQVYAIRAQVDALILLVQSGQPGPLPIDPAETCPKCGSSGETQEVRNTLDGTRRRYCTVCQEMRELDA